MPRHRTLPQSPACPHVRLRRLCIFTCADFHSHSVAGLIVLEGRLRQLVQQAIRVSIRGLQGRILGENEATVITLHGYKGVIASPEILQASISEQKLAGAPEESEGPLPPGQDTLELDTNSLPRHHVTRVSPLARLLLQPEVAQDGEGMKQPQRRLDWFLDSLIIHRLRLSRPSQRTRHFESQQTHVEQTRPGKEWPSKLGRG